ncbi:MAG: hypothetical protein K5622_07050 [Endomicrobiaceae bacterium]|nr:hypothetical protein [Endomicrobiaceae bacterium]
MPIMIIVKNELLRISPKDAHRLEFSTNKGQTWLPRYISGSNIGEFKDLVDTGKEIIATTSVGICYSLNGGRSWLRRR